MLSKVQKKSELEKIESNILCKLNQIPNFNSDLYQPLSLAIQMINTTTKIHGICTHPAT